MTVAGIDVSRWQGTTPSLAGLGFLAARATYGTFGDAMFSVHIANAHRAGLVTIAYHFGRSGDIEAQVQAFLKRAQGVDLFALDLERDRDNTPMSDAEGRQFIARVHALSRHKIALYASTLRPYPHDALGADLRWVADYRALAAPPIPWTFWQYTSSGGDKDRFNGSAAQLAALAHPAQLYRVVISGPTRLYDRVGGRVIGAVTAATYICARLKVNGIWWYRIAQPRRRGEAVKPNRYFNVRAI